MFWFDCVHSSLQKHIENNKDTTFDDKPIRTRIRISDYI